MSRVDWSTWQLSAHLTDLFVIPFASLLSGVPSDRLETAFKPCDVRFQLWPRVLELLNQVLDGFHPELIGMEIANQVTESKKLVVPAVWFRSVQPDVCQWPSPCVPTVAGASLHLVLVNQRRDDEH